MTRDEIDAKLTDELIGKVIRRSIVFWDGIGPSRIPAVEAIEQIRSDIASALQGEPERGKWSCAKCLSEWPTTEGDRP